MDWFEQIYLEINSTEITKPRLTICSKRSSCTSMNMMRAHASADSQYIPSPTAMPIMATIHMPAAVVRPRTEPFIWIMAPAPRKLLLRDSTDYIALFGEFEKLHPTKSITLANQLSI